MPSVPEGGGYEITDKRVSRRHAILEVVDSQLRIKPNLKWRWSVL
uniref:Aprataxin and PNKP like factor n=1 Tax=Mus musculus TaxID=10090 RepID=A0A0N4SW39_MOUSE